MTISLFTIILIISISLIFYAVTFILFASPTVDDKIATMQLIEYKIFEGKCFNKNLESFAYFSSNINIGTDLEKSCFTSLEEKGMFAVFLNNDAFYYPTKEEFEKKKQSSCGYSSSNVLCKQLVYPITIENKNENQFLTLQMIAFS